MSLKAISYQTKLGKGSKFTFTLPLLAGDGLESAGNNAECREDDNNKLYEEEGNAKTVFTQDQYKEHTVIGNFKKSKDQMIKEYASYYIERLNRRYAC